MSNFMNVRQILTRFPPPSPPPPLLFLISGFEYFDFILVVFSRNVSKDW